MVLIRLSSSKGVISYLSRLCWMLVWVIGVVGGVVGEVLVELFVLFVLVVLVGGCWLMIVMMWFVGLVFVFFEYVVEVVDGMDYYV